MRSVPVQMWQGVSPVAVQKWQGCAQSCRFGNGGKPSRGADDAGSGVAGEELPEARMVAELLARFACNAMTIVDDELREARCATCDRARAVSRWPGTTKCGVNRAPSCTQDVTRRVRACSLSFPPTALVPCPGNPC